ncbi:MAG: beta-propeller fold lactonase family protein [Gemmatales bacterium]
MKQLLFSLFLVTGLTSAALPPAPARDAKPAEVDRSPVDCLLSADEKILYTTNQTSGTISVVDLAERKVVQELAAGKHPRHLAFTPDQKTLLVTAPFSHELLAYNIAADGRLQEAKRLWLGHEPHGIVVDGRREQVYVSLCSAHQVAVVSLKTMEKDDVISVARWPKSLAMTPDGNTLVAGCSGDGSLTFIDLNTRKVLREEPFQGLNQGQMVISPDGDFVYTPYIYHFGSPPTQRTIKLGWVTASRVARIRVKEAKRVASLYLDTAGLAVSDPTGLAFSPNQEWLACTGAGTHEVLLFRNKELPFQGFNSRFLIDEDLRKDSDRYFRLPLGGRPMYLHFSKDNRHLYVANYLLNCIQVVDVEKRTISHTIDLGGTEKPSLARQGEAIFYDGTRGFDQWYSCASCHTEGHSNGIAMDTSNDGRFGNPKMVPSLRYVTHTGPWTWHGWQKDLNAAMQKSMKESMLGKPLKDEEVKALVAYFGTLEGPSNPNRSRNGEMTEAMKRGKAVFEGNVANCISCHRGEYFTDSKVHEVGLESSDDYYKGFNPPTLRGAYDRMYYLHDGRARTLEQVLTGPHAPEKVTGNGKLTKEELKDLVEYVRGL